MYETLTLALTVANSMWTIRTINRFDRDDYINGEVEEVTMLDVTAEFMLIFTLQPFVATAAWLRDNVFKRGA